MPGQFLPVAEESGLIYSLGSWALRAACRQLEAWKRERRRPPRLHVNLSVKELLDPALVDRVEAHLGRRGLTGDGIRLEITESAFMEDPRTALETLCRLRDLGIELCMDDFGTGYSCLATLTQIPVDILKIDRSFVTCLSSDPRSEETVRLILGVARNLGLGVVAEGVETAEQLRALERLRCDLAQGFLFGWPVAAEAALVSCERGFGLDPVQGSPG